MSLVASFMELVQPLSWTMTSPSFQSFLTILTGWIFAPRRTVSAMLVAAGVAGTRHHAAFYRLFSAARWSLDQLGLIVFRLILPLVGPARALLSLDDTRTRKRGLKIFGAGMHHDPLLSTRKNPVVTWGHSWVVLAVVVRLPCCPNRVFSLPILFRLYLNHEAAKKARQKHRARTELAVELINLLCSAHRERLFHVLADSTYAGETVLGHLPANCDLTSRVPLNARLHEAPPPRQPGQKGRPRKRGVRLPTPAQMLNERARRVTLTIYGRKDRFRLVDGVAYWYGVPDRKLRVVAVAPLTGGRRRQAFYTTLHEQTAEQVLTDYSKRWSIEEAFQGGKSHLGFEQPQGWSRPSVLRTAPMALVLYSLVVLWFERSGHHAYCPPVRPWYRTKSQPSFADMLDTIKRESLREVISAKLGDPHLSKNVLDDLLRAMQVAT